MDLTREAVNQYLRATGSNREFSFGSSARYEGRSMAELIGSSWATAPIVASLEARIIRRLQRAYTIMQLFMECTSFVPARGLPRAISPTFTSSTDYARDVMGVVNPREPPDAAPIRPDPTTPSGEDARWEADVDESLEGVYAAMTQGLPQPDKLLRSHATVVERRTREGRPGSDRDESSDSRHSHNNNNNHDDNYLGQRERRHNNNNNYNRNEVYYGQRERSPNSNSNLNHNYPREGGHRHTAWR